MDNFLTYLLIALVLAALAYLAKGFFKQDDSKTNELSSRLGKLEILIDANIKTTANFSALLQKLKEENEELAQKIRIRDAEVIRLQNTFTDALIQLKRPQNHVYKLNVTEPITLQMKTPETKTPPPKGKGVKKLLEQAGI